MTTFFVVDASSVANQAPWITAWQSWPDREVFAHPAYVRLFARPGDRVVCAIMHDDNGTVLFPLILRCISDEPWAEGSTNQYDLITPYGYGGPFAWGAPCAETFWIQFDAWCTEQRVVSTFARLSLFPAQCLPFQGTVETKSLNIIRTLELDHDAMWMDYEHKVRKNVKKAQRAGLSVEVDRHGERLEAFLDIYYGTMERRSASSSYYFSREFFQTLLEDLHGQYVFFHTISENSVVSTELVLVSANHVYSFLGGTLADTFHLRPNELLKHEIITWGRHEGKASFVLGGGYGGQDGIFHYKQSFAPHGVVPFNVGTRVNDVQTYQRLVDMRRAWEREHGNEWEPTSSFFPAYRG